MQSSTGPNSVQSRRGLLRLSVGIGLVGLVIAACGSEPPLPAAEYFPMVEAELARLDQATKDLTDRFATELENEVIALVEANPGADQVELLEQAIPIARSKMQSIISSHVTQLAVFAERVEPLPHFAERRLHLVAERQRRRQVISQCGRIGRRGTVPAAQFQRYRD